jgi:N-methylhydantoinase B
MKLDPVDYAVISQAIIAAASEMGAKLIRSSYSTIIREAQDASAGIMDRHGNVVAQAELIPMQLGPMASTFKPCAELFPVDELEEGDFYINNHPFAGGQHLQDIFIFSPIFYEGQVIGFGASVSHHLDLGGGNPGLNATATDVYSEGVLIPPMKLNMHRDWNGGPFERMLAANIRVPDLTIGDCNAQFAANAIAARRMQDLCQRYGKDAILETMSELLDYSERRTRAAIAEIPDGTYHGEDAVDDDGLSDTPLTVKAAVTIRGEDISVDFTGTCDQVGRNLNCPFSSTLSGTLSCLKSVLTSPDIPFNEGSKRPIHISAPYGSLLNPKPPAPVRARMEAAYRAFNAVMKAMAQVVPDKVIATGFDTTTVTSLSHLSEESYQVYLEVFGGGYGASAGEDGCDGVDSPLSNCANTPIEALDMDYDYFRVVGYGLLPDSCGHGRQRGGLGFYRSYEILKDGVNFAIYGDRFRIAPEGLFGGTEGRVGTCEILRAGERISLKNKESVILRRGDVLTLFTGGGGGYGPPTERSRAEVENDVRQGYISAETAQSVYPQAAE